MARNTLKIVSYNSTGLASDKREFIAEVINHYDPDIFFIQETWLLNATMDKLGDIHKDYLASGVSAMSDTELVIGRPKGGVGILWKKSMASSVEFYKIAGTTRACACMIKNGTDELLCVNAYMPTDNQSKTVIDQNFVETLDAVEMFIEKCSVRNVIFAGDMNADFSRKNAHDVYLKDFIHRNDLVCCDDLNVSEKGYTYHDPGNGSFTCIDHFIVSSGLKNQIFSVSRCDWSFNPSNHLPIILDVKLSDFSQNSIVDVETEMTDKPICWHKVTDDHRKVYCYHQNVFLNELALPDVAFCSDVKCDNPQHKDELDMWCHRLVECCLKSDKHLPRVNKKKIQKPYWKKEVKPFRDECGWWHQVWKQAGEPRSGVLYEQKTEAKRQYRYAVRRYKRKEEGLRKQRMAEAISNDNSRDFFREVKKVKSNRKSAPNIDGINNAKGIVQHFATKYERLFNSVPSDKESMKSIEDLINKNCENCEEKDRVVTSDDVTKAFAKLKQNKHDGDVGLVSTHLLMSSENFRENLAKMITAILTHGYHPQMLLLATIKSIPKDNRGNICDGNNYRGITLCNSISKLMDIILLIKYEHLLYTSDMQYAYKRKHSTAICSLVVKEVVNYYVNNGSNVYSCCVDATKAFDRVQHDRLFEMLKERQVPAIILRTILDMYKRQVMRTEWNGKFSDTFQTGNGVRQGGVISPVLFCVFMDNLLNKLENAGIGCWLGNSYFGAIGYADDLMILSPTVGGLKKMLNICEKFGDEYGVQYNATKTVCLLYSRQRDTQKPVIKFCGTEVKWVDNVKHLGSMLSSNLRESTDVNKKHRYTLGCY